jgi:hypothetical protein
VKAIAAGDFTGDGKADLLAIWGNGTLHRYPGNGKGSIGSSTELPNGTTWSTVKAIAAGDFTGDGKADLLAIWGNGTLHRYDGTTTGVDAAGTAMVPNSGWHAAVHLACGDFTATGKAGVAAIDSAGNLWYYPSCGDGHFTGTRKRMWPDDSWKDVRAIVAGDFTGNGKTDLMALWTNGTLHRYPGRGDGTLAAGVQMPGGTTWSTVKAIAAGDFTGDGKADLVAIWGDGTAHLYPGTTTGISGTSTELPNGTTWSTVKAIAAGDFTGDGKTDLLAIWGNGTLHLYAGTGNAAGINGTAKVIWPDNTWGSVRFFAAGDVLGDRKPSVVAGWTDDALYLYQGLGEGGDLNAATMMSLGGW